VTGDEAVAGDEAVTGDGAVTARESVTGADVGRRVCDDTGRVGVLFGWAEDWREYGIAAEAADWTPGPVAFVRPEGGGFERVVPVARLRPL
jgi:hypothetical protein